MIGPVCTNLLAGSPAYPGNDGRNYAPALREEGAACTAEAGPHPIVGFNGGLAKTRLPGQHWKWEE